MKPDQIKLKINNLGYEIVDKIFPQEDILSRIGNATAKFYIDQNMYRLDAWLKPFADASGDIDTKRFMGILDDQVFTDDKIKINISKYIPDNVRQFIPGDIVIDRNDISNILTKEGA